MLGRFLSNGAARAISSKRKGQSEKVKVWPIHNTFREVLYHNDSRDKGTV
jgi:hypothetical protein